MNVPSPLTVLHLVNSLQWGGVRRHVLDLAEGCTATGVRSLVAAWLPPDDPLRGRADVLHLPLYGPDGLRKSIVGFGRSVRLLRALIVRERIDVLHMHSRYAALLGAACTRGREIPRVYTAHNTFDDLRRLPWYPRDIIAPAPAVAAHFRATVAAASRCHIHTVSHGVRLPPEGMRPAADGPRFCFAGRLAEEKGVRVLADALRILAGRNDAPHADILGAGPLADWLASALPRSAFPNVRLHGFVERPEGVIAGATALLFPSLALDAAPYAVLEAMALGVPVIAGDLEVLRADVIPGKTGILVPAGDAAALAEAMLQLAADASGARRMGEAARAHIREAHAIERMCVETTQVYRLAAGVDT